MNDIHYGRNRKGIRLELRKKLEDWFSSIDDIDVQETARKNVIVTGGSIASMLLGEKVNDFDLYFRTKESTIEVAEYYVKRFNQYTKNKESGFTPEVIVEERVNIKNEMEERVVIWCQSFGTNGDNDYEPNENLLNDVVTEYANQDNDENEQKTPYRVVFMSENAITLSDKIQLVTRFYGEPDKIHSNYDFVHATCYYDYHKDRLIMPAKALESLLSRTLIYRGSLYPIASIFRMKKFIERGWRITAGQQLKIMWQISEIDLSDVEILREQLTGVDMAYMYALISALKNVDPDKINSTYVSEVIDRIFQ